MQAAEDLKRARGLASRLAGGEDVLDGLYEAALRLLDEGEELEPLDRAFLQEVRFVHLAALERAAAPATRRLKTAALLPLAVDFSRRGPR